MAVTTDVVSVGTTATQIVASTTATVLVRQPAGKNLWIGPTGVTITDGYPVHGETIVGLSAEALFAVVDSGTAPVAVLTYT